MSSANSSVTPTTCVAPLDMVTTSDLVSPVSDVKRYTHVTSASTLTSSSGTVTSSPSEVTVILTSGPELPPPQKGDHHGGAQGDGARASSEVEKARHLYQELGARHHDERLDREFPQQGES